MTSIWKIGILGVCANGGVLQNGCCGWLVIVAVLAAPAVPPACAPAAAGAWVRTSGARATRVVSPMTSHAIVQRESETSLEFLALGFLHDGQCFSDDSGRSCSVRLSFFYLFLFSFLFFFFLYFFHTCGGWILCQLIVLAVFILPR